MFIYEFRDIEDYTLFVYHITCDKECMKEIEKFQKEYRDNYEEYFEINGIKYDASNGFINELLKYLKNIGIDADFWQPDGVFEF